MTEASVQELNTMPEQEQRKKRQHEMKRKLTYKAEKPKAAKKLKISSAVNQTVSTSLPPGKTAKKLLKVASPAKRVATDHNEQGETTKKMQCLSPAYESERCKSSAKSGMELLSDRDAAEILREMNQDQIVAKGHGKEKVQSKELKMEVIEVENASGDKVKDSSYKPGGKVDTSGCVASVPDEEEARFEKQDEANDARQNKTDKNIGRKTNIDTASAKKVNLNCRLQNFVNVCCKLSNRKRKIIEQMGFGSLVTSMRISTIDKHFCKWLYDHFDVDDMALKFTSREIVGKGWSNHVIKITKSDVSCVLGIPLEGKLVPGRGPLNEETKIMVSRIRDRYNFQKGLRARTIQEKMLEEKVSDEEFRITFLLFTLGTLLCTTQSPTISPDIIAAATVGEDSAQYAWADFVFHWFIGRVKRYEEDKAKNGAGGCAFFIMIFYLDHLEYPNKRRAVDWHMTPRIAAWSDSEVEEAIEMDKKKDKENEFGNLRMYGLTYRDEHPLEPSDNMESCLRKVVKEELTRIFGSLGNTPQPTDIMKSCLRKVVKEELTRFFGSLGSHSEAKVVGGPVENEGGEQTEKTVTEVKAQQKCVRVSQGRTRVPST